MAVIQVIVSDDDLELAAHIVQDSLADAKDDGDIEFYKVVME